MILAQNIRGEKSNYEELYGDKESESEGDDSEAEEVESAERSDSLNSEDVDESMEEDSEQPQSNVTPDKRE